MVTLNMLILAGCLAVAWAARQIITIWRNIR